MDNLTFPATLESLRRRDLVQTLRIGAFLACMWALAIALGAAAWGMKS